MNHQTSLDKIRILLWDIDGTLMRSTVQGGFRKYFAATMLKVFGSAGTLNEITPSGMTDIQIMYESLKIEGFNPEQISGRRNDLLEVFPIEMQKILSVGGEPYEMLEGANRILAETAENPLFINSLLTGNLSVAAKIKLSNVGLWHFFENAPNAFGEISHRREDLAIEAGKLFNAEYDYKFDPKQFIVIGDTPADILCARHFGAKCVVVLTGRNQTKEKLNEYKPDIIVEDLRDTRKILQVLTEL